jgi:hypothetical protein
MKFVYNFHKQMREKNLNLIYEGAFTQEITKAVLSMAERKMDEVHEEPNVKKKVFNIMVECLQNICKHGAESGIEEGNIEGISWGIIMVGQENNSYYVTTGNYINSNSVEGLKSKLLEINTLDKEALKELYKLIIKSEGLSQKGGAGLGLVDIARKSGTKLEYDFEKINDFYSFYSLLIRIPRVIE